MALHIEKLNGGLVTARDPSLLEAGELSRTYNAVYRPYSEAIGPIGYRVKIGLQQTNPETGGSYAISGLRRLLFEDSSKSVTIIADGTGERWRYGPDANGNWNIIPNVGVRANAPIEAVHLGNRYILTDGVNAAKVVDEDLNVIKLGMTPLASVWSYDLSEVEGVTNCKIDTFVDSPDSPYNVWHNPAVGNFHYWITEYDSVNDIESSAIGWAGTKNLIPASYITATLNCRIAIYWGSVEYPHRVNPNATHWRIYRSTGVEQYIYPFPAGNRITTHSVSQDEQGDISAVEILIPDEAGTVSRYDYGDESAIPYPLVIMEESGVSTGVSVNDPPAHVFTTAETFQNSIVTNDTAAGNIIHYSYPGYLHSWPSLYTIGFDSKKADFVTCIRALGSSLIVGQMNQLWRVNYLPQPGDNALVKELISGDHGIVGPQAATVFTIPGDTPQLAYVAQDGLYSTNGMTTRPLTRDIDWLKTFRYQTLPSAILLNIQDMQSLVLFYVPAAVEVGGIPTEPTSRTQALFFSYAPEHLKGSSLKVSGPVAISAASADYDPDQRLIYTGGYDGQVRNEDQISLTPYQLPYAELIDATGMRIRTRIVHMGGLSGEWGLERVHIFSGPVPNSERQVETFALVTRDFESEPVIEEFGEPFTPGVWSMQEKHVMAGGMGVEIRGFAPITLVGLEHTARRGT